MKNDASSDAKGMSSKAPDWSRESARHFCWQPSQALIACIRQYQKYSKSRNLITQLFKKLIVLKYRLWSVVTGADIPINCQIGGGLLLRHPNGVVIHPDVKLGPNCLIFQQVTLGMRNGGVPSIGGHVDIGAGAKLLGKIIVGDHAKIGANSIVLNNVRSRVTVVGIPARELHHSEVKVD